MSGMQLNTDFSNIKPNEAGGQQFPPSDPKMGWLVKIIDSFPRETKNKDGTRAILMLEGLDQPIAGMTMEYGINVANPSQKSVEIGWAELSAVAHVLGILRVGNTMELHQKPFRVLVREQAENKAYREIYGVLDANGNPPGKAGQGPAAAQPAGGGFGGPAGGGGFGPGPGATTQQPNPAATGGGGNWNPNPNPAGNAGGGNWGPNGGGAVDPNATQAQQPGWGGGGGAQPNPGGGQPAWAGGQR